MKRSGVVLALAALALGGCWGDVNPIFPDGGAGTDDTDPPPEPELYPGGGVGAGPIDGCLNLYFVDETTGAALPGVQVMIGNDPLTALLGETAADGLVVLVDPALAGAVDVHAWTPGYVLETTLALAWTNATLLLRPEGAVTEGATATVSGELTGFDALLEPGPTEYRVARIFYGEPVASLLPFRDGDFAPRGSDSVELRPDTEGGAFSLSVPARPGALYALAGLMETYGTIDPADDAADWSFLGVVGGLSPAPGDAIEDVDLPLDTPLTVFVNVVLAGVPSSFERKDVYLGLDLGAMGTAWLEATRPNTDTFVFKAPWPSGDFADASPLLVGAAEQDVVDAADAGPAAELPRSFLVDRGFETWLGYEDLPRVLGTPLPAPASLAWDGAGFSCLPTTGRDLGQLVVSDAATGAELWRVTAWDDLPGSIPYPALPADWDAPAVPAGGVAIDVFVDTLVEGTSEMLFDDFSGLVTTRAVAGAVAE